MEEFIVKKNKFLKIASVMVLAVSLSCTLSACGNNSETTTNTNENISVESSEIAKETVSVEGEVSNEETKIEVAENEKAENKDSETKDVKSDYYPITYTTHNHLKEEVEVVIEKEPTRVVAVYQNSIETLLALGLEDKIVAAAGLDHKVKSEFAEAFEGVNYLNGWRPSKEAVIMLEPDFILSWYSYFGEKRIGDVDYFHDNKIGTYMALNSGAVTPRTLQNECEDILNIGKIFNVNEKAQVIVDKINNKVDEVAKKAKENDQRSTLIIEFYTDKIDSYGATSLGGDMVNRLGAKLLSPEGNDLGIEDIIALDPESIFVVYYNNDKKTDEEVESEALNKVLGNEALANISAVKNKRVYTMPLGEMYSSGVRTIDGIERFEKGIYE